MTDLELIVKFKEFYEKHHRAIYNFEGLCIANRTFVAISSLHSTSSQRIDSMMLKQAKKEGHRTLPGGFWWPIGLKQIRVEFLERLIKDMPNQTNAHPCG